MSLLETQPYRLFFNSLKSLESRKAYYFYLRKYMELQNITDLLAERDPISIEEQIINFIIKMTENGKHYSFLQNYLTAVLFFYRINDITLNTSKIYKFMPEQTRIKNYRAYTDEEIAKLLEIADERMRVIVFLLASTGMRIGAIPELKLRNFEKINDLYKITVYENSPQEYQTFCSHECLEAIDSYLNFRKRHGEKLGPDSYLIREQFDVRDQFTTSYPRRPKIPALTFQLSELAFRCGIRKKEQILEGQRSADGSSLRKEVALTHGFRKFFTTQCINSKMNPKIRELLLGNKQGLASYNYRPTEEEQFNEYLKVIDFLKINYAKNFQAHY